MMHDERESYAIVADIGGTFARFSRVNLTHLSVDNIEIYPCAKFISFESVLLHYQARKGLESLKYVTIAIACPVVDDLVCMTNCHWRFSIREVKHKLGLVELTVLNDFTAIAMSLPALGQTELMQIGPGHIDKDKTKVVLGAGTGLGVACLTTRHNIHTAYSGEGGHASWGATTEQEWFIYKYLKTIYPHVSYERILSGQGLEHLYKAIAAFNQQEVAPTEAAQIIFLALTQQCPLAQKAIEQFFATLGAYAGNLALTLSAFGGVYIGGGIVPRLLSLIHQSDFRARFEDKGRFKNFNSSIPTYVITAEQPGILGAAIYLKQSLVGALDVIS